MPPYRGGPGPAELIGQSGKRSAGSAIVIAQLRTPRSASYKEVGRLQLAQHTPHLVHYRAARAPAYTAVF